eukprot:scaffold56715_cov45-Prasinocladus_malaysianus.AAC.1
MMTRVLEDLFQLRELAAVSERHVRELKAAIERLENRLYDEEMALTEAAPRVLGGHLDGVRVLEVPAVHHVHEKEVVRRVEDKLYEAVGPLLLQEDNLV